MGDGRLHEKHQTKGNTNVMSNKGKIIYVPLEHIDGRYTTHMDRDILAYLNDQDIPHVYIMPDKNQGPPPPQGHFLNSGFTTWFKCQQMAMIADLYQQGEVTSDDTFFFSDIWFPGIESLAYMNYFHKITPKITGVIHAGSFTDTDFVRDMERWAKNFEDIIFDLADTIYCASNFIRDDIIRKRMVNPDKLVVSGLPLDVQGLQPYRDARNPKQDIVIFNGRLCDEKQPELFDKLAQELYDLGYDVEMIKTQEQNLSKDQYYDLLSRAKCVVSFALQENFGFGIAEAVHLGCVPVLPNRLVYPELYHKSCLYDTFDQCVEKVRQALSRAQSPGPGPGANHECLRVWFQGHDNE